MSIADNIRKYYDDIAADEHHRYRSWEHCYRFFRRMGPSEAKRNRDEAARLLDVSVRTLYYRLRRYGIS